MGIMYAMKCDICEEIQVKETAYQIEGKTYTENGKTMFSCSTCSGKLKTALSLGKGGLDDPLKAAAGLLEQKDEQIRMLEAKNDVQGGNMLGVADELRRKREAGGFVPVLGLDFETQYKHARNLSTTGSTKPLHALPAPPPKPKDKTKKRKK